MTGGPVQPMERSQPSTTLPRRARAPTGTRRLVLFLVSMTPVMALVVLLTWGIIRSDGNPGGLLVHNDSREVQVAVRQAPDFGGIDLLSGRLVNNQTTAGNVVMIDFWSSWCAACRVEAADLAEVYDEYADMPVEFVGLAIWDDEGSVLGHIDRYGVPYPNMLDDTGRTSVTFGVKRVPEKFFLDRDGTIVRKLNGPVSKEQLREILDALLAS